jgi:nitrogenase-stabilizing/protective protein
VPICESAPEALAECQDAEDYFRLLGVEYDERVLAVGRLHVLQLFGRELAALGPARPDINTCLDGEAELPRYRAALERAYAAFRDGGALQHRVFKVLRDRTPGQFVPDSALELDGGGPR